MRIRLAVLGLAAGLASGCAASGGGGQATLWVTRDRGAHVLLVARVPAGLTAVQALERKTHVKTRYGGRFVQAINGIEGSAGAQRDWFYFVNGYEADRGSAEYRLRPGDVEWWDYRSWKEASRAPVVVGAFPEPFLHGYEGKKRPTVIVSPVNRALARRFARLLHGRVLQAGRTVPFGANALIVIAGPRRSTLFTATLPSDDSSAGAPVRMVFRGDPNELSAHTFRFLYEVGR